MCKLSIKYWLKHKKRLASILLSLILGVSGLMCAIFFTQTANLMKYENLLEAWGAYNYVIPEISSEKYNEYKNSNLFECSGMLEIGGLSQGSSGNSYLSGCLDKSGEEIYHYSCRAGNYPKNKDEITASRKVLESFGVVPNVGEEVELSIYDNKKLIEKKKFRVAGILKTLDTERSFNDPDLDVSVPEIFFNQEYYEHLNISKSYMLARESAGYSVDDIQEYAEKDGYECYNMPMYFMAQEMMLNVDTYDELSKDGIQRMVDNTGMDFDSTILIPIFSIMVAIVIFVSIFSGMWTVLNERKHHMGLYRCLGMTKLRAEIIICSEMFAVVLIGLIIGFLLGMGMYLLIYTVGTKFLGMDLKMVLQVEWFIQKITLNPYCFPLLICGITAVFSSSIAFINWKDNLLSGSKVKRRKYRLSSRLKRNRCMNKMFFSDKISKICIFLSIFILMSSGFFGILYFLERTSQEYELIQEPLKDYDMGDIDYLVEKDFSIGNCALGQSNRHAGGVPIEKIEQLSQMPEIDSANYSIQAKSTKVLLKQTEKKRHMALYDASLKNNVMEGEGLDELYEKTLLSQGYKKDEELFNIATVGVTSEMLQKLQPYILQGKLNDSALASGKEVIIVTNSKEQLPFRVGDIINMSDEVITNSKIEEYNFSTGNIPKKLKNTFYFDYFGKKTEGYAFGKRVDYSVTVGAIVNTEEFDLEQYYISDALVGESNFNFLCNKDAFELWGLPDCNATLLGVKLNSSVKEDEFSRQWYERLGNCEDITTTSTYDIKCDMRDSKISYWGILWLLIFLLLLIGGITIINSLHRMIHLKSENIGRMMCFGVTLRNFRFWVTSYVIKGILLISFIAWIPAKLFDVVCKNYRHEYGDSISDAIGLVSIFPYHYNIFQHHFILIYCSIIIFMIVLVSVVIVLITRSIKKKSIVDIIGINRY